MSPDAAAHLFPVIAAAAVQAHQDGRLTVADAGYRRLLTIDPSHAGAWRLRALSVGSFSGAQEALRLAARAVRLQPDFWDENILIACRNLAAGRQALSDAVGAVRALSAAAALRPEQAAAWRDLGAHMTYSGLFDQAASSLRRAVLLAPYDLEARERLGNLALRDGRSEEAIRHFQRLSAIEPTHVPAWGLCAVSAGATAGPQEALRLAARAMRFQPALWDDGILIVCRNLAASRQAIGDAGGVARALAVAAALRPEQAELWRDFGAFMTGIGWFDRAETALGRAARLAPDDPAVEEWLGDLALRCGRSGQAVAHFSRALLLKPSLAVRRRLSAAALYDAGMSEPARAAVRRGYADAYAATCLGDAPAACACEIADPSPDRRLRIGYLTSDFLHHPVAANVEPLLRGRDAARFDAVVYALGRRRDEVSRRLRDLANCWRDVDGLSDADLASLIRADDIDVLVILAGGFDNNRSALALHRAAPVQVSMFDGGTSGFVEMDYLLSDPRQTPRGGVEEFSERVFRLPSLYVYPPPDGPEPAPPPVLRNGWITFGSFNNPAKLNDETLALWGRVLQAVPGSRLALKYQDYWREAGLRRRVSVALAATGVTPDRVIYLERTRQSRDDHLRLYDHVDIGLDPFPFCGATTTFEALMMGVPVVTLPQANMMSRASASILTLIGETDLIAASHDDYVAIARKLSVDAPRLVDRRHGLRGSLARSPLCDGQNRARHFHQALRVFWRRRCASPHSLSSQ
jgi:protein O-GlcNAc transferase